MDRYVCVRFSRRLGASARRGVGRGEVCYGGGRKRPMARVTTALRRRVVERVPPSPPPPPPGLTPSGQSRHHSLAVAPFHLIAPKSRCYSPPRLLSITPILDYMELPITYPSIPIWPKIPKVLRSLRCIASYTCSISYAKLYFWCDGWILMAKSSILKELCT